MTTAFQTNAFQTNAFQIELFSRGGPSPPSPLSNVVRRMRTLGGGYPTKARNMYVGRDFDPANATENEVYSLDFVNELATGETLSSVTSVTLAVFKGTDSNPTGHLNGSSSISGTVVSQRIGGGGAPTGNLTAGVTYTFTITVLTSLSNTLSLYSRIPCLAIL